jgi:hypothetical protein
MIRYDYLPFIKTENEIDFYDLTKLNWNEFEFTRNVQKYYLTDRDVEKFHYITEEFYDDLLNEDILYFINKIDDPMELRVGQEIILPSILDIRNFLTTQLRIKS